MLSKCTAVLMTVLMVAQVGCYNTYNVSLDELSKADERGLKSGGAVKVKAASGEEIVVSRNTKIGITDRTGKYFPVSPFNFTLSRTQLIAPDEDLLISVPDIATGNVKQVSGGKTALLVAGGVLAIMGAAAWVTFTAEEEKGFGQ